jgi:radical SAM-linked protein
MLRASFRKEGNAVWISHLDLMRVLQRAFRRAGIDLKHSQGFTPHPELSIALPMSVGVSSECELVDFTPAEGVELDPAEVPARLNPVLPAGLTVTGCWADGKKLKNLVWLEARLTLVYDRGVPDGAAEAILALLDRPELVVEKHGKKGPVEVDIRPMYRDARLTREPDPARPDEDALTLTLLCAAQNPTLNPLLLPAAIERYAPEYRPDFTRCRRLRVLDADLEEFR